MPRKIDLYWFIPALVKRSVGSERGTTEEDGTVKMSVIVHFLTHVWCTERMSALFEVV